MLAQNLGVQDTPYSGPYIAGGGGGGGRGGSCPRQENPFFLFDFAELFLVAILVRNHN